MEYLQPDQSIARTIERAIMVPASDDIRNDQIKLIR